MCLLRGVVSHLSLSLSLSLSLLCLMKHVRCIYLMHDKPPRLVAGRPQSVSVRPSAGRRAITIANAIGFNLWSRSTTSAKCSTMDGWKERESERERKRLSSSDNTREENAGDKGGISRVKIRDRRERERERERESFSFRPVIKERLSFCFDIRISYPSSLPLSFVGSRTDVSMCNNNTIFPPSLTPNLQCWYLFLCGGIKSVIYWTSERLIHLPT